MIPADADIMREVTIVWRAFANERQDVRDAITRKGRALETSATINVPWTGTDRDLLETIYHETNPYSGPIWNDIERVMPDNRTHTALTSMFDDGDHVIIDGVTYRCASVGWDVVDCRHCGNTGATGEPWSQDSCYRCIPVTASLTDVAPF